MKQGVIASMKKCYRADLRTFADEENGIIALWEKK
jgi:hypothetical protein